MKITRFVISDYHQFGYLNIDLTYPKGHPKEGKPLDKVCFIGKNGTGKSTILRMIKDFNRFLQIKYTGINIFDDKTQYCFEFEINDHKYLFGKFLTDDRNFPSEPRHELLLIKYENYSSIPDFFDRVFLTKELNFIKNIIAEKPNHFTSSGNVNLPTSITEIINLVIEDGLLLMYSPTEYGKNNSLTDIFSLTNLNESLSLNKQFPYYHEISFEHVNDFWKVLTYQVNRREQEFKDFLNKPENQKKAVEDVKQIFENDNPDILKVIADKWNFILEPAGLYFDYEKAKSPIQLIDTLIVYIKTIKDNKEINFHVLSSGIKNLILNIGYLVSLYFHRDVKSAVALFDEPEFSLFPDILLKLIDFYTNPIDFPNTQFFFATHSPLVASQFEPEERICLDFDEDRKITYTRGIAPLGDNPDDILTKDFRIKNLLGEKAYKDFQRYIEIKTSLKFETNQKEKEKLANEFLELGMKYNF